MQLEPSLEPELVHRRVGGHISRSALEYPETVERHQTSREPPQAYCSLVIIRRLLPGIAALAVLFMAALVILTIPDRPVCPVGSNPARTTVGIGDSAWDSEWFCLRSDALDTHGNGYSEVVLATTDHRGSLRLPIAVGGIALAAALSLALRRMFPAAAHASGAAGVSS
jgi:hypothetical protein